MRVNSLVYDNFQHRLVEVEVSLHPGLPGVQILGLPDAVVKDCVWRIKSAFLQSGFQWPSTSQVIVNLKPSHIRKKGSGLDLAIAVAILWETGQAQPLESGSCLPLLYGELDLMGEVHVPGDFVHYNEEDEHPMVITGRLERGLSFPCWSVSMLKHIGEPQRVSSSDADFPSKRPKLLEFKIPKKLAVVASVVAAGEHPTLFAGRAGSGKTTIAQIIHSLIEPPSKKLVREFSRFHIHSPIQWRPYRNPHHTTPALSMIGGGVNVQPGEFTRAHGGVLLLDEFLEFDGAVQEALREPMEKGMIELIRSARAKSLPAKFLLLATTNLCHCGAFEPKMEKDCSCGQSKRKKYLDRLSGPILDRFALLVFSQQWRGEKSVAVTELLGNVEKAIQFRKTQRGQEVANSALSIQELKPQLAAAADNYFIEEDWASERRAQHMLRVARSFADLGEREKIDLEHLESAREFAMESMKRLKSVLFDRFII